MRKLFSSLVLILFGASVAPAQFNRPPISPSGTVTSVPLTPAQAPGYAPYPVGGGVASPFGYGTNYIESPVSGYFNGIANVVGAYGQYGKDYQQSRLMNQDVERSKLATRTAYIQQQQWEQSLQPTAEDVRRQKQDLELRRAMNDPPLSEIIAGDSLNTLLKNIQSMQTKGAHSPTVPIEQEVLQHINLTVTPGQTVGIFKDNGKLKFPFVLRDTPFDKEREQIQEFTYKAVKEEQEQDLSPATLRGLKANVDTLDRKIEKMGPDMPIGDLIQAQRYVNELKSATAALQQRAQSSVPVKQYRAQGRTVGDLVGYMTKTGVRFAPAATGEESYYRSLYQSMAAYNYGTMQTMHR